MKKEIWYWEMMMDDMNIDVFCWECAGLLLGAIGKSGSANKVDPILILGRQKRDRLSIKII